MPSSCQLSTRVHAERKNSINSEKRSVRFLNSHGSTFKIEEHEANFNQAKRGMFMKHRDTFGVVQNVPVTRARDNVSFVLNQNMPMVAGFFYFLGFAFPSLSVLLMSTVGVDGGLLVTELIIFCIGIVCFFIAPSLHYLTYHGHRDGLNMYTGPCCFVNILCCLNRAVSYNEMTSVEIGSTGGTGGITVAASGDFIYNPTCCLRVPSVNIFTDEKNVCLTGTMKLGFLQHKIDDAEELCSFLERKIIKIPLNSA